MGGQAVHCIHGPLPLEAPSTLTTPRALWTWSSSLAAASSLRYKDTILLNSRCGNFLCSWAALRRELVPTTLLREMV